MSRTTSPAVRTRRRAALLGVAILAAGAIPATADDTIPCDPATGLPCGPTPSPPPSPPPQCTPSPPPQPSPPDTAPLPVPQPPTTAPLPTPPGPIASLGRAEWDFAWKRPQGMVAFTWTAASGAVSYDVKITPGNRCKVCKTFKAKGVPVWHETRNTFYEFHGLVPKGKYRVEVRGVNSYGTGPVKARVLPATP